LRPATREETPQEKFELALKVEAAIKFKKGDIGLKKKMERAHDQELKPC
jgi:hypothetical protein